MCPIPELNPTLTWVVSAVLAICLFLIARLVAKRKGKKNWLLMFVTIILSAALLVFVLLGLRGCGIDIS
ncbi:MAG: hypothetical protein IK041_03780 [Bacteroidales bacterium]|nr:hypothetical protein [Bacteroidales bacterium]